MTWNEIRKLKIELINSRELYQSESIPKYLIMLRVCKSVILKKMLILLSLGNGPLLGVYSTAKGVLLIEKCLLQGSRIHGIRGTLYI